MGFWSSEPSFFCDAVFYGMTSIPGRTHAPKQRFRNEDLDYLDILPRRGPGNGIPIRYGLVDPVDPKTPRFYKLVVCDERAAMAHIIRENGNTCRVDMGRLGPAKQLGSAPNIVKATGSVLMCSAPLYLTPYNSTYAALGLSAGPVDDDVEDEDDFTFEQLDSALASAKKSSSALVPPSGEQPELVKKWKQAFEYGKAAGMDDLHAKVAADVMFEKMLRDA